jgi:hypothetical protein
LFFLLLPLFLVFAAFLLFLTRSSFSYSFLSFLFLTFPFVHSDETFNGNFCYKIWSNAVTNLC